MKKQTIEGSVLVADGEERVTYKLEIDTQISLTGEVATRGQVLTGEVACSGCIHDLIVESFAGRPEGELLKMAARLHLCSMTSGEPPHAVTNAMHFLGGATGDRELYAHESAAQCEESFWSIMRLDISNEERSSFMRGLDLERDAVKVRDLIDRARATWMADLERFKMLLSAMKEPTREDFPPLAPWLSMVATWSGFDHEKAMDRFDCLFRAHYDGVCNEARFTYWMGLGHRTLAADKWGVHKDFPGGKGKPVLPTREDVLGCLVSDALAGSLPFAEFCDEFGYDPDSRTALRTWEECEAGGRKLRKLLGSWGCGVFEKYGIELR